MNRINWKASAKSGEWMVNQFDATTDFSVRCLLDTADDYILTSPHLVEESISIAAALAAELLARGKTGAPSVGNLSAGRIRRSAGDVPAAGLH